ncbi:hypothetical protein CC2G_009391 [Coprinopsis cinerea AmutBmut pab1-1]|nr:hypothetical protein CC2G_009391 [Coprinopsis cinerea AmutBmut pab1-1]
MLYVYNSSNQALANNPQSAIERWTDSVRWGPSRVRDEFLYYQEKQSSEMTTIDLSSTSAIIRYQPCYRREPLIKQTYSVFVSTPHGQKKWHLIAYYTQKTLDRLYRVRDNPFHPELATIRVPPNVYQSARSSRPGPSQRSLGTVAPASTSRSPSRESSETSSTKSSNSRGSVMNEGNVLPPLEALQDLVQPTRHPLDEKAIMSFPLYEFFIASP